MTLRVCLLAYRFPILGRSTDTGFLWPIARELAKEGHDVTVISARSPIGKHDLVRNGVQVYYLYEGNTPYTNERFDKAALNKFQELHQTKPFDIVHSMDNSALEIAHQKESLGIAVCYDVEATQISQIFALLGMSTGTASNLVSTAISLTYKFLKIYFGRDRGLLQSADGIFVSSPIQRIFLERYYLYPDFHIYSVPYGVELSNLEEAPIDKSVDRIKSLGLPNNSHIAITLTDFREPREIRHQILAFEKVAIKKPKSYLLIIGAGQFLKDAEKEALNLALGNRVFFLGQLNEDEISSWISCCEVLVDLGARGNGFDTVLIEAMAQRKVIIGSEMGPLSHIIEDGIDGFLIRPADSETLAHLMIGIFSGTIPMQEIGEKARQKVINLFDLRKMVVALQISYEKIISNTTSRRRRWLKKNDKSRIGGKNFRENGNHTS